MTRCTNCDNSVMQKSEDSVRFRVQGPITIGHDGICRSQCYWCKTPVELPLELVKSLTAPKQPERFIIVERGRLPKK